MVTLFSKAVVQATAGTLQAAMAINYSASEITPQVRRTAMSIAILIPILTLPTVWVAVATVGLAQ